MHKILPQKKPYVYCSLIIAMILGRVVWGAAMFIFVGVRGGFTFTVFIAGAVVNAIPGIVLQLVLVPIAVMLLDNVKVLKADTLHDKK